MIDIGDDHDIAVMDSSAVMDASTGVSFVNADWQVSDEGLEHRSIGYFIGRDAIAARRDDRLWAWPLHLSEKTWCKSRLFREAFMTAVDRFGLARDPFLTQSFATAFGLRPGSAGASKDQGFVALGDLVRPKSVARKRPAGSGGPTVSRRRSDAPVTMAATRR